MTSNLYPDIQPAEQPSLWRHAPVWRHTLVLAVITTAASTALLISNGVGNSQNKPFHRATAATAAAMNPPPSLPAPKAPDSTASTQTGDSQGISTRTNESGKPNTAPVKALVVQNKPQTTEPATPDKTIHGPSQENPLPHSKGFKTIAKPGKTAPVAAATGPVASPKPAPATPLPVQSEPLDAACPNLATAIPLTEPRYNQGLVVAIRSTESSANTMRRSMQQTGAVIDEKYRYQILAALALRKTADSHGMQPAAIIPPDLHIQQGDIVAWDGAYRDRPGQCHYVPARIRAVVGHINPPAPETSAPPVPAQ